ncbi:MAG: hypothetical protein IE921_00725 [Rhodobacteraceae bacterium]|nr:hypothetical protein [Paracoccaceae bacterium]
MTDRERQIEELYDSGLRPKEIAEELGLSRRYAQLVIFRLGLADTGIDIRHHKAMERGSTELLAAIRREHAA